MSTTERSDLLVCVKCLRGETAPEDGQRPGEAMFAALAAQDWPEGLRLIPTECLSNCNSGCSVALRGPGKWSYVYGNLHEASHPDIIAEGARAYHATDDGLVPWRQRPQHFRKNCIARIPPMDLDAPKPPKLDSET
ncbi:MAG: DUF1636 family protein [Paracoccaceae bacterium]